MAGEWTTRYFGELTTNFDGRRKPVKESDRRPGPYPYYGASGVVDHVDGYLFDGEYLLIAEDGENLRTRQTPIAFMAKGKFWVNNHAHIVTGNDKADTRFLMYALQKADISGYLTGAVMPKLTQGNLNKIELICPPLAEQRAIAHILGTLDDKIELNRKQNETLEAMARALFNAWFVDFEPVRAKIEGRWQRGQSLPGLPAHPACAAAAGAAGRLYDLFPDRLVESELGEIPEGWGISTVGEHMVNFDAKRVPLSGAERTKRQGPYPYYGAAGVVDHVNDYLFDGIYLLVGEDGSVVQESGLAVTQYVWGKMWVNNHAHVLQGKGAVSTEQLYLYFQFEPVAAYVTGAVQPKLSQGRMNMMPFVFAGEHICRAFAELVRPWFAKWRSSADANKTLANLRDTLLPKLISGELRVKDAETFLKERGL